MEVIITQVVLLNQMHVDEMIGMNGVVIIMSVFIKIDTLKLNMVQLEHIQVMQVINECDKYTLIVHQIIFSSMVEVC